MITKFKTNNAYYPYAASKCGRVKNLKTGNIRKATISKSGYAMIGTKDLGHMYVHRIVLEIWEPQSGEVKPQVNHIDGNKSNNNLDNLEWCTRKENMQHAADSGLLKLNCKYGEECNLTTVSDEIVIKMCEDLVRGDRNVDIARRYSVPPRYVKELKSGRQRKCITKDYVFKIKDKRSVSEDTVVWICNKLASSVGITEIVNSSSNKLVTIALVKNIKYGKCYADISQSII